MINERLAVVLLLLIMGKAHRIAASCNSVKEIIDALQHGIHFESSDVLESRLTAIPFDNRNLTDFATEVAKLADR